MRSFNRCPATKTLDCKLSIAVSNCLDHFDRRLSKYEGNPPLFRVDSSSGAGFTSSCCDCVLLGGSGVGGTSKELPASTPGIGAGSREASSKSASSFSFSLMNLSVSAEALSLSLKSANLSGCRRNWHCTQTEKLRGVGLTENAVGTWRNRARTGAVRLSWRLERSVCPSSCGIDCMAKCEGHGLVAGSWVQEER